MTPVSRFTIDHFKPVITERLEPWKVASAAPLAPGQRITVLGSNGLTLDVQADPTTTQGPTS